MVRRQRVNRQKRSTRLSFSFTEEEVSAIHSAVQHMWRLQPGSERLRKLTLQLERSMQRMGTSARVKVVA